MTINVKTDLENYVLDQEIGRGDLTVVYQGRPKSGGDTVAIKVVAPQFTFDEFFVRRFLEMGKQAARLEHPNIVRTYETRQNEGILYVVREWVDSKPLSQVLEEEGPFTPQRMLTIARQIAAALDYAHQKSIMHGDLSAQRVFVGQDDHVTLADFGQTQAMAGTSLVKQGYAVGSPETLAPERVHGQGPSRQSDLYSLGILCYQMLNNEPPFTGAPAAVLHAQAYEQPRPLHMVNPGVSVRLSEAIGRMLAKGLELRYTTGSEFTRALTVAAEGTAPMRASTGAMEPLKLGSGPGATIWQRPWFWGLVAIPMIVILLGAGFLAVSLWARLQPGLLVSQPIETAAEPPTAAEPDAAAPEQAPVILVEPTATTTLEAVATDGPPPPPTNTPTPAPTPTFAPLPTPGPPRVVAGSPFTNLKLAHGISADSQPEKVGTSFAPGSQPIYLFFDYANIEPGSTWSHKWTWGDTELEASDDVWPDTYFDTGTAWVFYSPGGGFQPGPYQVTLEVNGQVVATATFVVQPGGL